MSVIRDMIMMSMSVRPLIMSFNTSVASTVTFNISGNATVDWGDGQTASYPSGGTAVKVYSPGFVRTIKITGAAFNLDWTSGTGANGLIDITQWGDSAMSNSHKFVGCTSLVNISAVDVPVFSYPCNASYMFSGCTNLNAASIGTWNVSNITFYGGMFTNCSSFNVSLNSWSICTATSVNMGSMFVGCTVFNQPLSNWNMSTVNATNFMFQDCTAFNQPLWMWNFTSTLFSTTCMFWNATSFNQTIATWNVSGVGNFSEMFRNARAFNNGQAAGVAGTGMNRTATTGWRTNNAYNMNLMFADAVSFNQNLNKWCVSYTGSMPSGFDSGATAWTQPRPVFGTCPIP